MLYTIKRYRTAFATVTKPKELSSLSSLGLPPMDNLKRKMQLFSCVFDRAVIIMMVAQTQWYKLLLETREPCLGQAAEATFIVGSEVLGKLAATTICTLA